jgi:hypothetical protein
MEDTGPVRKHADVDVIYSDGSRGHVAVDRYQSGHVDFNVISGDEGPLATFRLAPGQAVMLSATLVTGPDDLPTSGGQHLGRLAWRAGTKGSEKDACSLAWPEPYRVVPLPPAASLLVSRAHCSRSAKSSPVIWTPSGKSWLSSSAADICPGRRAGGLIGSAGMRACWGRVGDDTVVGGALTAAGGDGTGAGGVRQRDALEDEKPLSWLAIGRRGGAVKSR